MDDTAAYFDWFYQLVTYPLFDLGETQVTLSVFLKLILLVRW